MPDLPPKQHGGKRAGAGRKPLADPNRYLSIRLPERVYEKFKALGGSRFVKTAVEAAKVRYEIRDAVSSCTTELDPEIRDCYIDWLDLGEGTDSEIRERVKLLQEAHDGKATKVLLSAVQSEITPEKFESMRQSVAHPPAYLKHVWKIIDCKELHSEIELFE